MDCYLYILKSQKNNSFYIGSSENPKIRLKQHNAGQVKATRWKRPYKLLFIQKFPDRYKAFSAELKLKSYKRKDFIEKIIRDGIVKKLGG